MNFTEVHRSSTEVGDKTWALHAQGCADIQREINERGGEVRDFSASTVEEAKHIVIDEALIELGYSLNDLKVYGCCTHGPKAPKVLAAGICTGTGQTFDGKDGRGPQHLYRSCPVCGKLVGAKRGIAPRHKS